MTDPTLPDGTDRRGREFEGLLAEVTGGGSFGHREHVRLTWLAVRRFGVDEASDLVCHGIRRTARYEGAPQKYHVTMSRAWVALVSHHVSERDDPHFDAFLARNPALLDKRLLTRFYEQSTLASPSARHGWVVPDREPFPWLVTTP